MILNALIDECFGFSSFFFSFSIIPFSSAQLNSVQFNSIHFCSFQMLPKNYCFVYFTSILCRGFLSNSMQLTALREELTLHFAQNLNPITITTVKRIKFDVLCIYDWGNHTFHLGLQCAAFENTGQLSWIFGFNLTVTEMLFTQFFIYK